MEKTKEYINIKLNNAWVAWLMLGVALLGGIYGFVRYAESKPDRSEVSKTIDDKITNALSPVNVKIDQLIKQGDRIERKLDGWEVNK